MTQRRDEHASFRHAVAAVFGPGVRVPMCLRPLGRFSISLKAEGIALTEVDVYQTRDWVVSTRGGAHRRPSGLAIDFLVFPIHVIRSC